MAKVLRRLLNEARDKMTDEELFTSTVMKQHFESIIEGVCKTSKRHIAIRMINEGSSVASTNGNVITVNLNNDWIKSQAARLDKYYIIVGIILHECGHILYTDFRLMEKCFDALEHNRLFPIIDYSETLAECFDENMGRRFLKVYQTLDNCVEDGHIEKRVIRHIPGYGECLLKVRKLHLSDAGIETYEKRLKDAEGSGRDIDRIGSIIGLVLIYAKFGVDNTGEVTDDLTKLFYRMMPHIDNATGTNNATLRKREANIIFDMLIDFISDELKRLKEKEKPEPKDEPSRPSDEKEKKYPPEGAKEPEAKEEAEEPASPSISEAGDDSKDENKSSEAEESESKMSKEESV